MICFGAGMSRRASRSRWGLTLKTHLRSTYRKLGVQTRREAVLQAERLGIL